MAVHNLGYASLVAIALVVLSLSGCGGGGGGGSDVSGGSDGSGSNGQPVTQRPSAPTCTDTVDHGCISNAEFLPRRDANAAVRLADPEFLGSATPNFFGQPTLELINAHKAHAALAVKYGADVEPGEGVTIAVLDSGVDLDHEELDDADITETFLQNLPDEARADFGTGESSHGTAVTSIMAAEANDTGFLGIAWGATFKVFTVAIGDHLAENDPRLTSFD